MHSPIIPSFFDEEKLEVNVGISISNMLVVQCSVKVITFSNYFMNNKLWNDDYIEAWFKVLTTRQVGHTLISSIIAIMFIFITAQNRWSLTADCASKINCYLRALTRFNVSSCIINTFKRVLLLKVGHEIASCIFITLVVTHYLYIGNTSSYSYSQLLLFFLTLFVRKGIPHPSLKISMFCDLFQNYQHLFFFWKIIHIS